VDWQVLASIRIQFDDPADEVRHGAALRKWVREHEAFGYDGQFWGDPLELAFWIMGEEEAERRFGGRVIRDSPIREAI
jgi:hypothetical protein